MNDEASRRLATARRLLRELEDLDPGKVPTATIHAAYYAMFHAATAIVLDGGGRRVRTHSGLIAKLAATLRQNHPDRQELVARLGRAFDARMLADYDDGGPDVVGRARYLKADAPAYIAACEALLGP
ncbi:MAG TPA: HEPN domain-containing protein [Vineibacter sp.]|nr:HEPN domain-containing protein [Vineibacter sp.]